MWFSYEPWQIWPCRVWRQDKGGGSVAFKAFVTPGTGGVISGVALARAVAGVAIWMGGVVRAHVGEGGPGRAFESEGFDGIDDAQSVADAGYAHLLEGVVVELQQDVASDVVVSEGVYVCVAFYVGEPSGDVGVGPGLEEAGEGRSGGWLEGATHGGGRMEEGISGASTQINYVRGKATMDEDVLGPRACTIAMV